MKAIIVGVVLLVLLILLNPGIERHRETVGEFFEKRWVIDRAENYDKQSWFTKAALFFAGDQIKDSMRSEILGRVYRDNYVIFSLGRFEGEVLTVGALGYVHVWCDPE